MIIDLICDRLDGVPYKPGKFYRDVLGYMRTSKADASRITMAMDYGDERDVKYALHRYCADNEYGGSAADRFIDKVDWL